MPLDDPIIAFEGPASAWAILWETLQMDSVSNAFDTELKLSIADALAKIKRSPMIPRQGD